MQCHKRRATYSPPRLRLSEGEGCWKSNLSSVQNSPQNPISRSPNMINDIGVFLQSKTAQHFNSVRDDACGRKSTYAMREGENGEWERKEMLPQKVSIMRFIPADDTTYIHNVHSAGVSAVLHTISLGCQNGVRSRRGQSHPKIRNRLGRCKL